MNSGALSVEWIVDRKKKILLADDVELFLELETTFFRRENFELQVARDGRQALEIIAAERPDLVFMDLYMPVMNGDECCLRVKSDPELRSTPIVMVTQGGREEDLAKCRQAGCDDILLKPINRHLFVDTACRLLAVAGREAQRVRARLEVRYGPGRRQLLCNYSVNISTGGLFLETDDPLPVDTPLELEFTLPSRQTAIRCNGRVAWVNHPVLLNKPEMAAGMGVQFVDLRLDDMHAIRDFIKQESLSPSW
jgi:uncharacterized protein (TIGR02266 family)